TAPTSTFPPVETMPAISAPGCAARYVRAIASSIPVSQSTSSGMLIRPGYGPARRGRSSGVAGCLGRSAPWRARLPGAASCPAMTWTRADARRQGWSESARSGRMRGWRSCSRSPAGPWRRNALSQRSTTLVAALDERSRPSRPACSAGPLDPHATSGRTVCPMTETTQHEDLTVGRVAELVGVSVRTLHHWDAIGLVRPGGRSWAGYRLYDAADVARIHRVLVYRELGLALAEIGRILDDPSVDPREHLRRQKDQLAERIRRLERTARAVDEMIERTDMAAQNSTPLSPEEQARIFGT